MAEHTGGQPAIKQNSQRGIFIVFEGGDGAGKSTQISQAQTQLVKSGYEVVVTREPGGSPLGSKIRSLLLDSELGTVSDRTEALLFAADRADHVASVIIPALGRGAVVLCDRYIDSSIAYQGIARGLGAQQIADLSCWATDGLIPDLTIVFDLDPIVGLQRAATTAGTPDRMEQESLEFHAQVRQAFLDQAQLAPNRYSIIDASAELQLVTKATQAAINQAIGTQTSDTHVPNSQTPGSHTPDTQTSNTHTPAPQAPNDQTPEPHPPARQTPAVKEADQL